MDLCRIYAQKGNLAKNSEASIWAILARGPIKAFPIGSWSANGRSASGVTGARDGLGIKSIQLSRQQSGMYACSGDHHSSRAACKKGASRPAWVFQMRPGENGLATALVDGMVLRALYTSCSESGFPVQEQAGSGISGGPCQTL